MTETRTQPRLKAKRPRRVIDAKLRARIEAAVEQMIAALDAIDAPLEDAEEDDPGEAEPDGEPGLGSTEAMNQEHGWKPPHCWNMRDDDEMDDADSEPECEDEGADHDGREPDVDAEPDLGWTIDGELGDHNGFISGEADDPLPVAEIDRRRAAYRERREARRVAQTAALNGSDCVPYVAGSDPVRVALRDLRERVGIGRNPHGNVRPVRD